MIFTEGVTIICMTSYTLNNISKTLSWYLTKHNDNSKPV